MPKIERNTIPTGAPIITRTDERVSQEMIWNSFANQFLTQDQSNWFNSEMQSVLDTLDITRETLKKMLSSRPVNNVIFSTPGQYPEIDEPVSLDFDTIGQQFPLLNQGEKFQVLMRFIEACKIQKITF